jgi:hypothetical protein
MNLSRVVEKRGVKSNYFVEDLFEKNDKLVVKLLQ